ncbi:MAG: hypothetical protein KGL39_40020 [Patescibacteria group bacterium]|nr:hypothetical protein [Patescibacteria group bacterium]
MKSDRTIRTDRRASLSLEGQWHGPGRVANTSAPFRKESERQSGKWHAFFDRSPDFWAFIFTAAVVTAIGLLAVWVAL